MDDLFILLNDHHESLDDFQKSGRAISQEPPVQNPDTTSSELSKEDYEKLSKYEKIRLQKKEKDQVETRPGELAYWKFAFTDYLTQPGFKSGFSDAKEEHEKRKEREDYFTSYRGRKEWNNLQAKKRKKGVRLGIDKIVMVNPFYMRLDIRKENEMQYIKSELGQDNLRQLITETNQISNLKITTLDVLNLKGKDTDRFNEIRFLNEWFSEQIVHDDMSLTVGYSQEKINQIAEKYDTDYFLWIGLVSLRAVRPKNQMLFFSILYDVRTGKREVIKFDFFKKKDSNTFLKAHLFDTLVQIKTPPKKK